MAVGSGKADDKGNVVKPSVAEGDSVLYSPYAGTDFEVGGCTAACGVHWCPTPGLSRLRVLQGQDDKQYVVVKDSDVLAVLS